VNGSEIQKGLRIYDFSLVINALPGNSQKQVHGNTCLKTKRPFAQRKFIANQEGNGQLFEGAFSFRSSLLVDGPGGIQAFVVGRVNILLVDGIGVNPRARWCISNGIGIDIAAMVNGGPKALIVYRQRMGITIGVMVLLVPG
jgi:hypothetical protein